jgi:hypothetical protein
VEPADDVDERRIRKSFAGHVDADAGDGRRAILHGEGRGLLEQPRLSNARLARDQDDPRLTSGGTLEGIAQSGSLGEPADKDRTRDATRHGTDDAPGCLPGQHGPRSLGGAKRRRVGSQ